MQRIQLHAHACVHVRVYVRVHVRCVCVRVVEVVVGIRAVCSRWPRSVRTPPKTLQPTIGHATISVSDSHQTNLSYITTAKQHVCMACAQVRGMNGHRTGGKRCQAPRPRRHASRALLDFKQLRAAAATTRPVTRCAVAEQLGWVEGTLLQGACKAKLNGHHKATERPLPPAALSASHRATTTTCHLMSQSPLIAGPQRPAAAAR